MVTALLYLNEGTGPTVKALDQMLGGLPHSHDVIDQHRRLVTAAEQGIGPALALHLGIIADDRTDALDTGEAVGVDLGGTTGHDDFRAGPFPCQLADRLARLSLRLRGHGAGIDDDRILKPGSGGVITHHLTLIGIEATAEGDQLHRITRRRNRGSGLHRTGMAVVAVDIEGRNR